MRCFFSNTLWSSNLISCVCVCVDEINESMIFKVPGNTFHEIYDLPLVSVDFIRRSTTLTNSWAGAMLKKDLVEQYLQAKPWRRVLQHHSDNVLLNRRHLGIHIVDTYVELYILHEPVCRFNVDKCRVYVVDIEISGPQTSQPCGGSCQPISHLRLESA